MATPDPVAGEWAIELIPVNDTGRAFYLQQYKPFRLAALKQDAEGEKKRGTEDAVQCSAVQCNAIHVTGLLSAD